jgi:CheY-like chemotaxis protein
MLDTVLLIDDDETDHFFFKRLVQKSDLIKDVICFHYADEALEFLKSQDRPKINVIFLDINMPRMNGFEFLEEATNSLPTSFNESVNVVMLTSSIAPQDQARAATFDIIKAYVNKPLDANGLANVVTKVTDGH